MTKRRCTIRRCTTRSVTGLVQHRPLTTHSAGAHMHNARTRTPLFAVFNLAARSQPCIWPFLLHS